MKTQARTITALFILLAATAAAELPPEISGARPGDPGEATEIEVGVILLDVSAVDGAELSFTADLYVLLSWRDPRLAGVFDTTQRVPLDEIWNPRLQILNRRSLDTTFPEQAEISPDGTVVTRQRYFGSFSVALDLHDFPLDRQRFDIALVVPGYSPEEVRLVESPGAAAAGHRVGEFSVADWSMGEVTSAEAPFAVAPGASPVSGWRIAFDGHRYLGYWVGKAFVSVAIIAAMSWIVFWLDPKYVPPRMSITITSMLTLVAYRFLLGGDLPQLAYLTRMDHFLIGSTLLVLLTVIQVAFTTALVDRGQGSRAKNLNRASRWVFPAVFVGLTAVVFWLV
jgi:hypothetical protein